MAVASPEEHEMDADTITLHFGLQTLGARDDEVVVGAVVELGAREAIPFLEHALEEARRLSLRLEIIGDRG